MRTNVLSQLLGYVQPVERIIGYSSLSKSVQEKKEKSIHTLKPLALILTKEYICKK